MKLEGIFPPVTTPFDPSDTSVIAPKRLRENVERYNRTGLAGYVVNGSTGESVFLSDGEVERVWSAVREGADAGKILIAGTGVDSTAETIARTNRAAELGYHIALVKTPHYYKKQMTPQALAEHYRRVADAARIPILIYSVPQFTGLAVEAPLVAELAQHPNVLGMKESSGNVQRVAEIVHRAPTGFQTLVGSAGTLYPSLALGAKGAILALACVLPERCVELYDAVRAGDSARAAMLQHALLPASLKCVSEFGIPGVKHGMDCAGYYGGPARPPFLPLTEAQKREIHTVLTPLLAAATSART